MPVPLLKTAAAVFFSTKNGLLNQTGGKPTTRLAVVQQQQPTELYAYSDAAGRRRSYTYPSLDDGSSRSNGGFNYNNGQYGYSPWSDSSSGSVWTSSGEDFYRHVLRPCESEQYWQQNGYSWGEDDYTLSQVGGSNQDKREADTKKCLKEEMAGGYVRGAWVKTMDSASGQDRWSQIGFGNFHFAQGNCATEHTSSWATDAFSNEGVFPEDKGVGGADWRNPVVQQFWRGHFGNGGPPSPGLCVVGAYEYKHYPCSKGFEGSCKEKNVLSPKHRWANYYGQICGEGTVLSREGLGLCMDEYSNKVDTKLEQTCPAGNPDKMIDPHTGGFTDHSNGACGPNARCLTNGMCACVAPADPERSVDATKTRCDDFAGHFARSAIFEAIAFVAGKAMYELTKTAAERVSQEEVQRLVPYDGEVTLPANSPGYNISLPKSKLSDGSTVCAAGLVSLDGSKCLSDLSETHWATLNKIALIKKYDMMAVVKVLAGLVFAKLESLNKPAVDKKMAGEFVEARFQGKRGGRKEAAAGKAGEGDEHHHHVHVVEGESDHFRRTVVEDWVKNASANETPLLAIADGVVEPISLSTIPGRGQREQLSTPISPPTAFQPTSSSNLLEQGRRLRAISITPFASLDPNMQALATALATAYTQATVVVDTALVHASCSVFDCDPMRGATCISGSCECIRPTVSDAQAAQGGTGMCAADKDSPSRLVPNVDDSACSTISPQLPRFGITADGLYGPSPYDGKCFCPPDTGFDGVRTCVMRVANQGSQYNIPKDSIASQSSGQALTKKIVEGVAAVGAVAGVAVCCVMGRKKSDAREGTEPLLA